MSEPVEKHKVGPLTVEIRLDSYPLNPRETFEQQSTFVLFGNRTITNETTLRQPTFENVLRNLAAQVVNGDSQMEDPDIVSMKHVLRAVNKHYVCLAVHESADYTLEAGDEPVAENDDRCEGLIWISMKKMADEWGSSREHAEQALRGEIEEYSAYRTGDCYGYGVIDENGEEVDACWGFYDQKYAKEAGIETAKDVRYVPQSY